MSPPDSASSAPSAAEATVGSSGAITPGAPAAAQAAAPGTRAGKRLDRSIVEGPIARAVWKMAWPTVLQNAIGGLQGIIDHAMVGHYVGFTGNAAIGVSWQIFLVVIVFMASLFTGQAVLVARFVGAGDAERVNRTVQQALLTAVAMYAVIGPIGFFGFTDLFVVVLAVYDWRTRGRIHPATLWGGAFLIASQPLRLAIGLTPAWATFVNGLAA